MQKNFTIRNGLEVDSNLLVADSVTNSVGIGTSNPNYTFEVIGGIGATDINILGISTVLTEFNVGTGGTAFTSLNTGLTGFGTAIPVYVVDIRSPVSTGQTALYVQGDVRITGDLSADDITLDQATFSNVEVTGVGTIANFKSTNTNVSGVTTTGSLVVNTGFDVYAADSTFHGTVTIDGNLSIGGTTTIINAAQLRVEDKDIVLGFTTSQTPTDDTANHGGIAIASTEGYPLISMSASGINTLPDTYKQIMWLKRNTMGAGTTDAFLFNYAVGIGSTQVPNGVRFASGTIQFTDNVINTTNLNVTGVGTIRTSSIDLGQVKTGIITNLTTSGIASITNAVIGTGNINIGVVTTISGSNLNYSGIGSFGSVNAATGRINTGIVTNLSISGVSTFANTVEFDSGLKDIYNQVGIAGSILVSTGVGVSWTPPFAAGIQGIQGIQGTQGVQGITGTGTQGIQGTTGTGTQGTQGIQGISGVTGTGTQGTQGIQGISGVTGTGIQGAQGTNGSNGTQGATGAQGTNGSNGTQGATGAQGTNGSNGTQGATGAQGTNGSNGTQGATGATGAQGTNGSNGTQGATGATGAQGTNGSNGTQGATGATGAQGTNGSNGTQGATGAQGTNGSNGTQGTQGITGSAGSITDDTSTNSTLYPLFQSATSGTLSGVSVSSPNFQFNPATGTLSATIFTSLSDKTQKTNIRPIENSIELVKQLEGVRYDWINNDKPSIGVIAQDIEKVLPEVVEMNTNGLKSVSYGNIVGVLIEAIKEQQVRIEELERKLNV